MDLSLAIDGPSTVLAFESLNLLGAYRFSALS